MTTCKGTANEGEPVDMKGGASADTAYWNDDPCKSSKWGIHSDFLLPKTRETCVPDEL